jgi:hypothetical protein
MIRQAYTVGPATALFIADLWDRATLHAYWDSLDVLQLPRWYSCRRVERAAHRLLIPGLKGRLDVLRWILEEKLDFASQNNADLNGQLVFPFARADVRRAFTEDPLTCPEIELPRNR